MKEQESHGSKFIDTEIENTLISFEKLEEGFTNEQLQALQMIEKHTNQRNKEIILIAKSVNELAQIFNELSVLILQQGSVLDRIDFNVENTVAYLQQSQKEITKVSRICNFFFFVFFFFSDDISNKNKTKQNKSHQ